MPCSTACGIFSVFFIKFTKRGYYCFLHQANYGGCNNERCSTKIEVIICFYTQICIDIDPTMGIERIGNKQGRLIGDVYSPSLHVNRLEYTELLFIATFSELLFYLIWRLFPGCQLTKKKAFRCIQSPLLQLAITPDFLLTTLFG